MAIMISTNHSFAYITPIRCLQHQKLVLIDELVGAVPWEKADPPDISAVLSGIVR